MAQIASVSYSSASELDLASAKSLVAPFYEALNPASGKDAAALLNGVTTSDWVSCGANDICSPRGAVVGGILGLEKAIPTLVWTIRDVVVSGDRIVVRGEASGTPAGDFMGVPNRGKSFRIMSIDIHTVENGKISRSYHVEDWADAARQLSAK